jgi:hypothetical protein
LQITPRGNSLVEGVELRTGEALVQRRRAGQHQPHLRLSAAHQVCDQADLFDQLKGQQVRFVDQQQHPFLFVIRLRKMVDQRQPQFSLFKVAIGQAEFVEDRLQQLAARIESPAAQERDSEPAAELLRKHLQQQRLAGAGGSDQ